MIRRFLNLVFLLLLSACTNSVNKTEFVNPIFNQPLRPLSSSTGYTYLTTTSIDMRTPKDKNTVVGKGECELIENTQERITLKCKYKLLPSKELLRSTHKNLQNSDIITRKIAQKTMEIHASTYEKYFTYRIYKLYFDSCLAIEETLYEKGQDNASGTAYYCVTPPDNYKSESD